VLLFAVVVIGCSATAKEIGQRTLGTWLTFEPRRRPVFLSKVLAPALWAVPLALLLMVGILVGTIAVLEGNGVPEGMNSGEWADLAWISLRVVLLAMAVGVAGAALGFVLRHVAILIVLLVGYVIAVESILVSLVQSLQSWTVGKHVTSRVLDGTTWQVWPNEW
jgi:ABC-2 type transport system permease protein